MKGWELYSWQFKDEWRFALVNGTNRLKTAREIIQPSGEGVVIGVNGIERELARLPKGEEVFWGLRGMLEFSFPPQATIAEIQQYCAQRGIQLTIIPPR